jgi:CRP-like cAMP-binding protein
MSGEAYSRLVVELILEAKRFGSKPKNKKVRLRISESTLSEETGLTRETVSREMKKLKDKNLITLKRKKIIINNIDNLSEELLI